MIISPIRVLSCFRVSFMFAAMPYRRLQKWFVAARRGLNSRGALRTFMLTHLILSCPSPRLLRPPLPPPTPHPPTGCSPSLAGKELSRVLGKSEATLQDQARVVHLFETVVHCAPPELNNTDILRHFAFTTTYYRSVVSK